MYKVFIRPSIEYGNIIYINCTQTETEALEAVQRRAARIITGGTISAPSLCLAEELALESLETRRERNALLMFHRIANGDVPDYLQECKPTRVADLQRYHFRHAYNFVPPRCRTVKYQKSFIPKATMLWNSLGNEKEITDFEQFKSALQSRTVHNELFYLGSRKINIIMAKIRMNCSELGSHLHRIKVIDTPACKCGQWPCR